MYFKRIELNGFKSFADPVTIEFTDGITCIVGPNGSGKSNISDAIRWVLGEQSPKSLRGGKMEDVIFAGTQNRKAKGMAEVTLVIDNAERTLPIDFAEVGITRRMYRSGESEYMINRTPCRLRDIRELIMDTGIGVEGYSVIGQGKIADIVSNKMESRREIFEEAAGIVKYRTRKADTEKNLETTKLNLDRVNDIVNEIEGRIGGLQKDSEKAVEYVDIRDKYKKVEINVILKNIASALQKASLVSDELDEIQKAIDEASKIRNEAEAEFKAIKEKSAYLETRLNDLHIKLIAKNDEIHFFTSRDEVNKEKLESFKRENERINAELASADEKIAKQSEALKAIDEERIAAAKTTEEAVSVLKAKTEALAMELEALSNAENDMEAEKQDLANLVSEETRISADSESQKNIIANLERRIERLKDEGSAKEENAKQTYLKLEESTKKRVELEEAAGRIQEDLEKALSLVRSCDGAIAELNADDSKMRMEAENLSSRKTLLEELDSVYEGYGSGVKFLMQQGLPGIIGVLGDLIKVPQGWELAIETALGSAMQDIVCETEDTAKEAIGRLKVNKAGRLTFLPENTLRPAKLPDIFDLQGMPGFLGLASERVTSTKTKQHVLDYVLGKVVVVDDLDHALKMAKNADKGIKFVTLEGEVVNAAGAITGGTFKNNTANILTRRAEKDALYARLKALFAELKKTEDAHAKAESALGEASTKRDILQNALRDKEMERAILDKEIEQLKAMAGDANADAGQRMNELDELTREVAFAKEKISENEKKILDLKDAEAEKENKIKELQAKSLQHREAANKAQDEETQAKLSQSNAALVLSTVKERVDAVNAQLAELEESKKAKQEELESNDRQIKQIADFGGSSADVIKEREEQKAEIEAEIEKLTAEKADANTKENELDEIRRKAESNLYDKQVAKHEAENKIERSTNLTDSLKEKLWEEFELSYAQAAEMEDPDFVMSRGIKEAKEYRDRMRALGDVNIGSIEEYKAVKERYEFLSEQKADILKAMDELNSVIEDTDKTIKTKFKESFDSVVDNFEITFSELFEGGHAKLSLEDPDHPMESSIEIEAQPPGKKLQNINLLSGGEKTMTAIALMCAVLRSKPTPFCILDEVEAALDETNIGRFAQYLSNFKNTQFALVTHQKATMEYADVMYGVTMAEHGVTKVLSLKLEDDFKLDQY